MKFPSPRVRSVGRPCGAPSVQHTRRSCKIRAQNTTASVEESSVSSAEADELEALRLENERLRLRAQQIGARVPDSASVKEIVKDVMSSLPAAEDAVDQQNGVRVAATQSGEITIEPQVHEQPVEGTQPTRAETGTSATVDYDHSEPPPVSAPVEEASSPFSPTNNLTTNRSSANGSSARAENRASPIFQEDHSDPPVVSETAQEPEEPSASSLTNGSSKGSTYISSNGSTARKDNVEPPDVRTKAQEPEESSVSSLTDGTSMGSTSTFSKGSTSTPSKKKTHEWQVLSAERLGLYASPHSTFPTQLPTDETEAIGTVPNYLPPSNESGLLRRIPQSQDELLQEMEELELKNPSASLQALREAVKQFSAETNNKHIKFNQRALGSMLHNLVFVSAEAAPYSKTGGLGDVVGSLTVALADRGHRVMVVCPRYITTARDRKLMGRLHDCQTWVKVDLGNGEHWVNFHHEARRGVDWVFVEHLSFERPGGLYGNNQGIYADNLFRYALLSQAACEAALQLQLPQYASVHEHWKALQNRSEKVVAPTPYPDLLGEKKCACFGEEVTFVANDWHAGLVPLYLNHKYKPNGVFEDSRAIVAIHNLAHQGTALAPEFPIFNLPQSAYNELEWIYEEPDGRRTPVVNIMKGALLAADSIVTVSETYAWEITRPEHGVGLHSILHARRNCLVGILNGMDTSLWDPSNDPHLPYNFSADDLSGKAACKAELRRKIGLPEAEYGVDVPLVGFVGRLDPQKGPDIIISALSGLLALDCQIVMLGSGHPNLEQQMKAAERDHPDFFRGVVQFSEPLAHQIMAASDMLFMPSRFEPCGLNQMHAMRYGTVPIAHATGGLQDTVLDVTPFAQGTKAHGTGWTFSPASDEAMIAAVKSAVAVYRDNHKRWENIQLAGMTSDWGWGHAAQAYESVVRSVLSPADER